MFYFIGTGVSGGEEGALLGHQLCQVDKKAYELVAPILEQIAAKAPADMSQRLPILVQMVQVIM